VASDGSPRAIGFGLARYVQRGNNASGLICAPGKTWGYAAPEVAGWDAGAPVGAPADMWALGAHTGRAAGEDEVTEDGVLLPGEAAARLPGDAPPALRALLVDGLLAEAPGRRAAAAAAMGHPYFAGMDWAALRAGRLSEC
jgi:hypothetical protein